MTGKSIILDANILIRAALGTRVSGLLAQYGDAVRFYTASHALDEARQHLPDIIATRPMLDVTAVTEALETAISVVQPIDKAAYSHLEHIARQRIEARDPDDWPLVALALALDCPVWTEDNDFFGTGLAVWNTRNVEIYFQQ